MADSGGMPCHLWFSTYISYYRNLWIFLNIMLYSDSLPWKQTINDFFNHIKTIRCASQSCTLKWKKKRQSQFQGQLDECFSTRLNLWQHVFLRFSFTFLYKRLFSLFSLLNSYSKHVFSMLFQSFSVLCSVCFLLVSLSSA